VVVAFHTTDPDAACGRGAGHKVRGYKLHAIRAADAAMPAAFEVRPLNVDEQQVAKRLIPLALDPDRPGYLLADANYDGSKLFDLVAEPSAATGSSPPERSPAPAWGTAATAGTACGASRCSSPGPRPRPATAASAKDWCRPGGRSSVGSATP
jgi:hypothetical protein